MQNIIDAYELNAAGYRPLSCIDRCIISIPVTPHVRMRRCYLNLRTRQNLRMYEAQTRYKRRYLDKVSGVEYLHRRQAILRWLKPDAMPVVTASPPSGDHRRAEVSIGDVSVQDKFMGARAQVDAATCRRRQSTEIRAKHPVAISGAANSSRIKSTAALSKWTTREIRFAISQTFI
ncbi:hypothetical protein EVAR_53945_1 [Eumeta japonica]|uniref:Uncharacterized protein n=1 Tax=Eumeta variegata TaxID=151549 RepID=A0A4C1ZFK8_EUMVA|nr:hypothetical protein EVAR_53945_1 [Eumeta japonica]